MSKFKDKIISTIMYDTILLCGGGGLGWAYIGALEALIKSNKVDLTKIETIAGISIGSVIGFLLQVDFDMNFLKQFITNINVQKLENLKDTMYFLENFGFDDGEKVVLVLETCMIEKYGKKLTFKDLYDITKVNFIVQATNLNKYCLTTFSHKETPELYVAEAIRMSISIPFYFTPKKYNNDYYVDGGILTSVPFIDMLTEENKVIVLHVKRNIKPEIEYTSFVDYMFEVWLCFMNNRIEKQVSFDTIEFEFDSVDVIPSIEEVKELFVKGYQQTNQWIEDENKKAPYKKKQLTKVDASTNTE